MLSFWQRLRFSLLLRAGAGACFLRDAFILRFLPHLRDSQTRRYAASLHVPGRQKITLGSEGHPVEAQLVMPTEPQGLLLLCHGIGERLYFWNEAQLLLADANIGSLVFHYPGYGKSGGPITPSTAETAARAAYAHLAAQAPGLPLFVFGTSLGTAVAAHVAGMLDPAPTGLILSQGFPSLREATGAVLARLHLPAQPLTRIMPDVWRNTEALYSVRCPTFIIHSPDDQLFPLSMGEALSVAAAQREGAHQHLCTPPGFAHNDVSLGGCTGYWPPIIDFIRKEMAAAQCTKSADAATSNPPAPITTAVIT